MALDLPSHSHVDLDPAEVPTHCSTCTLHLNLAIDSQQENLVKTPILFLLSGPVPLSSDPSENKFWSLSRYFRGVALSPVWNCGDATRQGQPNGVYGSFEYYTKDTWSYPTPLRQLINFSFYILKGWKLYKEKPYEVIITYGIYTTGWAGFILKKLTGAQLIIEIPGHPIKPFLLNSVSPRVIDRVKTRIAAVAAPFTVKLADHLRLLYDGQLDDVVEMDPCRFTSFHEYTDVKNIEPSEIVDNYILAAGCPWYIKGIDLLIVAFRKICEEFPDVRLKVVGYTPDRKYFEDLAAGHPQIELGTPVPHTELVELMRRCRVFVCPSRSESFPRVLNEAMAAGRPVIASDVGGIPTYIDDGINGILFKSEDIEQLAEKLTLVLSDREFATQIGKAARREVLENLNEERYVNCYHEMVLKLASRLK